MEQSSDVNYPELTEKIKLWGKELGFAKVGICEPDLTGEEPALQQWLDNHYHGDMDYMARHGMMRARANELLPGTLRVISARMDYLPGNAKFAKILKQRDHAYVSRYALGRDYHKLLRQRLKQLGERIKQYCASLNFRPFVDSAPVLERPLAAKAGLGWIGKHSLLLDQDAGSWFFLGELLVDIPLPIDEPLPEKCGSCVACIKICPTDAIVAPYVVDARRCISYLTIELRTAIPQEFRSLMGNRIYGCDDCQLICPWNRFANLSAEADFQPRQNLDEITLLDLFSWDENTFDKNLQGSPIRRIGYECWQRNLAVALGNAKPSDEIISALENRYPDTTPMVQEHIEWALKQQRASVQAVEVGLRNKERLVRSIEKGLPRDA
ncbi:tRNA epoxyqueuosine(34) reductase QueG [Thalassotalea sp. PS06]|uniref:tRNA epoxyqueuosine(34) reductase QueG n=1 Tax=Thalassotalea sp. PS06 TaxID=2594005 RepID=UPI0011653DC9|nr:tRNA epoxyqueuosine(34) reductase QueG [Thalassotalea sp. PS06]QDP00032.1 tRNA epoxyqueuosine(34) reductase QueG [Thalassotalea sp. PS06]